eukprot:8082390-Lingulodinium_polyedra.AAC.1
MRARLLQCAIPFLRGRLPPVPNWGKWTKTGLCLDRLLPLMWCGHVLKEAFDLAFAERSADLVAAAAMDGDEAD